jgi:HEAT repeat protein
LDNLEANRGSKLESLLSQALKAYPTEAIYPFLEDPFAIVRIKAVEELLTREEQLTPEHQAAMSSNPARETDLTLDEDDLYSLGSELWLLVFQALKSWDTQTLYSLLEDAAAIVRWQAISALRTRGEVDTFGRACAMCFDPRNEMREIGAQILCQLGPSDAPLRAQSVPLLLELLVKDLSPSVRAAAAAGFGHLEAFEQARSALVAAAEDTSAEVREAVAFGLGCDQYPLATTTLLELMEDSDEDVRDIATWGVGTLRDEDSAAIREALFRRLTDSDDEVRLEAFAGLAVRKDKRIIAELIHELETIPDTSRLWESALLMLGGKDEPSVSEVLTELRKLPIA